MSEIRKPLNVTRKRKPTPKTNPMLHVLLAALVIIALIGAAVYFSGYRYINIDGVKYSGFTHDGQPVNGTIKYPDGEKGKFTKDKDSAFGKIEFVSGDLYEGEFKGILRHGKGTMTYKDEDMVCTGTFVDDKLTGYFECVSEEGSYSGDLVNGLKDGVGKFTMSDSSYYYGEWKDGARHGNGEMHFEDGSYYYGSYDNDKKAGLSEINFTLENGSVYVGECKFVYANGDIYVGDFENDKKSGIGTYTWASGESYTGEFKNDTMNGKGTYDFADGKTPYTGMFIDGKPEEFSETDAETKAN